MIAPTRSNHRHYSARMRAALATLTVTQRQALYLTIVEGRPITSVARRLDLPQDVAESICSATRAKLYEQVA